MIKPLFLRLAGLVLLLLAGCTSNASMDDAPTDQFSLTAGPAAAADYPMTILYGVFTDPDGGRLTVPAGHFLQGDWTGSGTFESSKRLAAPDSLYLLWYSYLEDTFYEGRWALPQHRIHELLKQGYWNHRDQEAGEYDELTVCVLPKGAAVVWLSGLNKVLLGRYQGQPTAFDFASFIPNVNRAETRQYYFDQAPTRVQAEIRAGTLSPAKWDAYLKLYPWKVEVTERTGPRAVPLRLYDQRFYYVNAERLRYPATKDLAPFLKLVQEPSPKPVPVKGSLYVANEHQEKYELRIDSLDEQETMAAYQEVARRSNRPMTLHVEVDGVYKKATLTLKNDYHEVPLRKAVVEIYRQD